MRVLSPNIRDIHVVITFIEDRISNYFWQIPSEKVLGQIRDSIKGLMIENKYYYVDNIRYNTSNSRIIYDIHPSNKFRLEKLENL